MGKYVDISEFAEYLQVREEDILYAENTAEGEFGEMENPPEQFIDYIKLLALQRACIRLAQGEDTIFIQKAKSYKELAEQTKVSLTNVISRSVETTGTARFYRG
ncbi:hypothetical protein [Persephonella sp.]